MQRQLTAFVEQPCQATYVAARDAVMRRSPLVMVATDFAELERLLSQEAFQVLLDRLDALPASKILSHNVRRHCSSTRAILLATRRHKRRIK